MSGHEEQCQWRCGLALAIELRRLRRKVQNNEDILTKSGLDSGQNIEKHNDVVNTTKIVVYEHAIIRITCGLSIPHARPSQHHLPGLRILREPQLGNRRSETVTKHFRLSTRSGHSRRTGLCLSTARIGVWTHTRRMIPLPFLG